MSSFYSFNDKPTLKTINPCFCFLGAYELESNPISRGSVFWEAGDDDDDDDDDEDDDDDDDDVDSNDDDFEVTVVMTMNSYDCNEIV